MPVFDLSACHFTDDSNSAPVVWRDGKPDVARLAFVEADDRPRSLLAGAQAVDQLLGVGLRSLTVGLSWFGEDCSGDGSAPPSLAPLLAVVGRTKRPALRELALTFGDSELFVCGDEPGIFPDGELRDLGALWPQLPNLERLVLCARDIELGRLVVPNVRDAELFCWTPDSGYLTSLRAGDWPRLERLVLDLGGQQYTGSEAVVDDLIAILREAKMPSLRHLCVRGFCCYWDRFFERAGDMPVLAQLETFALIHATFETTAAERLLENRAAFARLRRLILVSLDGVEAEHVTELEACCEQAIIEPNEIEMETWRDYFPSLMQLQAS